MRKEYWEVSMDLKTEYEQDFYAWINHNVSLLRQGQAGKVDIVHIAEELESMGKHDRRVLLSRLQVLLMYLLKWKYQAQFQGRSWLATIDHQRDEIEQILIDSPSLRNALSDTLPDIYKKAVRDAKRETGLPEKTFPVLCPFELDSILCQGYYPEAG